MKNILFYIFVTLVTLTTRANAAVDEATFLRLGQEVFNKNEALVADAGGVLQLIARYNVNMFVAGARRDENNWIIEFWGGYPRLPEMTADGLQLLMCHEVGHHIGGAPVKTDHWATAEGQADDYAARHCIKNLWNSFPAKQPSSESPIAKMQCEQKWGAGTSEAQVCERTIIAGWEFLSSTISLDKSTPPYYDQEDTTKVETILETHPNNQCRLDTIRNAALGLERPGCWFPSFH